MGYAFARQLEGELPEYVAGFQSLARFVFGPDAGKKIEFTGEIESAAQFSTIASALSALQRYVVKTHNVNGDLYLVKVEKVDVPAWRASRLE